MIIAVDPESPVPPFEQVRMQIAMAIASGRLGPEERLPTVRQLADDLGLAVNTVARAYKELEAAGQVVARGRHGTFVAGDSTELGRQGEQATREFVARMRQLGFARQQILAVLRRELEV